MKRIIFKYINGRGEMIYKINQEALTKRKLEIIFGKITILEETII